MFVSVIIVAAAFAAIDTGDNQQPGIEKGYIVDTFATGLTVPWAMVFTDSSTMIFTERSVKVRWMRNDQLQEKPLLVVKATNSTKKMGLLGLYKHPDFTINHFIYLAYKKLPDNGIA